MEDRRNGVRSRSIKPHAWTRFKRDTKPQLYTHAQWTTNVSTLARTRTLARTCTLARTRMRIFLCPSRKMGPTQIDLNSCQAEEKKETSSGAEAKNQATETVRQHACEHVRTRRCMQRHVYEGTHSYIHVRTHAGPCSSIQIYIAHGEPDKHKRRIEIEHTRIHHKARTYK